MPQLQQIRIIPARAGQTRRWPVLPRWRPDHPRACGANLSFRILGLALCGSSPRVRGKPAAPGHCPVAARIIPARAGQTNEQADTRSSGQDHPRACGANVVQVIDYPRYRGSSPRVRGKPGQVCIGQVCLTDHPRACGANIQYFLFAPSLTGSSPRVRGKPCCMSTCICWPRIIPARAGQTP